MFWNVTQALMSGLWTTFEIFILTLIFSLPLGLIFAFGLLSRFKPVKAVMNVFVWVIRGTPLMLQLIIIFYGPGLWLHQAIWSGDETGRITATKDDLTCEQDLYARHEHLLVHHARAA